MLILGTQGIGTDLNLTESFRFLDLALDLGISNFDTAERYPFPESSKNFGLTESIIGEWIQKFKINRSSFQIGSKVTGRNFGEISNVSSKRLESKRIITSAESSLKRLKTDYLDIFYLHWPDRFTNNFGREFYNPDLDPKFITFEEQYNALYSLKKSGKILKFGLCNESPWGLMRFTELARIDNFLPTIQEEFSIINRSIERSFKEIIIREKIDFYSYSPLSGGLLTGKYHLDNNDKDNIEISKIRGRLDRYPKQTHRHNSKTRNEIVEILLSFCKENNLTLSNLAFSFLKYQNFISGVILGASNEKQLVDLHSYWHSPTSEEIVNLAINKISL